MGYTDKLILQKATEFSVAFCFLIETVHQGPHVAVTAALPGPRLTPLNLLWPLLSSLRTTDLTCHVLPLISDLRLTMALIAQTVTF